MIEKYPDHQTMLMSLSMDGVFFLWFWHKKICAWKTFPPSEMSVAITTLEKKKQTQTQNPTPRKPRKKQTNTVRFLSDRKQILLVKIVKYFYMRGTFLKPQHVLRPFPFHSAFHLCTFSKSSHQCNIIPLYQNSSQKDLQKEGKMSEAGNK